MAPLPGAAGRLMLLVLYAAGFYWAGKMAYAIRIYAIKNYGYVIHEFDPWFNYRATEYLAQNGWTKFFQWFDYKVWYPLGRPVGTTIYPGMQISSVVIWKVLKAIGAPYRMSLNDVCCMVPAWFGATASWFLGGLTAECSGSWSAGAFAALIMSVIPAHTMRSVAGGYDNESIALTAMCATFFCWVRALRHDPAAKDGAATTDSVVWGVLAGLAYTYMVAAWGGYVFVLNMVGIHAAALFLAGRYTSKLHRAFSLFYAIGTYGATRVPVVGFQPLKSFEQLAPLGVFLAFQVLEMVEVQRRKHKLSMAEVFKLRVKYTIPFLIAAAVVFMLLWPTGYFGPISSRVRALFVKHTRTGNPLVDSVAEHQPANEQAYQHYLHHIYHLAPWGLAACALTWTDSNLFIVLYACVAYYFANKMARLMILLGPVASALGGIALGVLFDQLIVGSLKALYAKFGEGGADGASAKSKKKREEEEDDDDDEKEDKKDRKGGKGGKRKKGKSDEIALGEAVSHITALFDLGRGVFSRVYNNPAALAARVVIGVYLFMRWQPQAVEFYEYSHQLAEGLSQPQIMYKAKTYTGQEVLVDDYREAYWWLRDHTPEDARVMAWWDYGYQITGIGNRTTIADGNTWNHEHIATLGLILSAPEERAWSIARHLADYVLVWAGGGGDDLAKSPHMARIGNSVYRDICPGDPTCSKFGFYQGGKPTPMMEKCLLYKLTMEGQPGVAVNQSYFQHVFSSKYGKVRIYKIKRVSLKSKKWVEDPENRVCDAPGSWYCTGQYPPAIHSLIEKRKPFAQLEDFNRGRDEESDAYHEEYHKRMAGKHGEDGPRSKRSSAIGVKYIGCTGSEADLGNDRVYEGGAYGANIEMARMLAKEVGKKYFAISRTGTDGHAFAFDELRKPPTLDDSGCRMACLDHDVHKCGCADEACGGLKPPAGESNVRRWAVYELTSTAKAKPKAKAKRKSEL